MLDLCNRTWPHRRPSLAIAATLVALALIGISGCGRTATKDPALLRWAPPPLTAPITVDVADAATSPYSDHHLRLNSSRDYILQMPPEPLEGVGGLWIEGGHNVVLIGGEINVSPTGGETPSLNARRGLYLKAQTGTVHVEGLYIHGPDLSEGINLDQRLGATVQIENVRVESICARDEVNFTDTHPDLIQTWAGPSRLRVDRFSGTSDYQGIFLGPNQLGTQPPPEEISLRRIHIRGTDTARYLLWRTGPAYPIDTEDIFIEPSPSKSLEQTLWPNPIPWSGVSAGPPPEGDFVPADSVGVGYETPGYSG